MREERPISPLTSQLSRMSNTFVHFPEDEKLFVKIGMEFFYAVGPEIVHYLKGLGHSIFLDLNCMISQIQSNQLCPYWGPSVDMVTVHAAGGVEMMREAKGSSW